MALSIDNSTIDTSAFTGLGGTSVSFSFTCSGVSLALFVIVYTSYVGAQFISDINTPTYNGVNLTRQVYALQDNTGVGGKIAEIWAMVNPPTGANTVQVTRSDQRTYAVGAVSFNGAHQTLGSLVSATATKIFAQGSTPSLTLSSAVGEIVLDAICAGAASPNTISITGGQTGLLNTNNGGSFPTFALTSYKAGASSVTVSYDNPDSFSYAYSALSIVPAADGGPFPHYIRRSNELTGGMISGGM